MGLRGPAAKSAKAIDLAGTARKDRPRPSGYDVPVLASVPTMPEWISGDKYAVAEWDRLAPLLVSLAQFAEQDIQTLANLCVIQSRIMRNFIGEPVSAVGCHSTYKQYASALGLAAGWRSRVVKGEKEAAKNPFEAFKGRTN